MTEPQVFEVHEGATGHYTANLTDETGAALPLVTLSTLTLTLYVINADSIGSASIVNGRNAQNVLNINNVTVSAAGLITWTLQPADTTLVLLTLPFERHIALFQWTWSTGKAGKHEVVFLVKNMQLIVS